MKRKKDSRPDFIKNASEHLRGFADALWREHDPLVERKAPVLDVIAVAMDTAECEITKQTPEDVVAETDAGDLGELIGLQISSDPSIDQIAFFRTFCHNLLPDARAALLKELQ